MRKWCITAQASGWILSVKFQEYSRNFQEPEIEFSRSLYSVSVFSVLKKPIL